MHTLTGTHTCTCMYSHAQAHVHLHMYTHACVHTNMQTRIHTDTKHTYAHTYTYGEEHARTHTHIFSIPNLWSHSLHSPTDSGVSGAPPLPLDSALGQHSSLLLAPSSAPLCGASSTPGLTTSRGQRSCQHPKSACEKAASPLPAFKSTTPLHPHRTSWLRPITDKQVTPPHRQAVSLHPHLPSTWDLPSQKLILT